MASCPVVWGQEIMHFITCVICVELRRTLSLLAATVSGISAFPPFLF